LARACAIDEVLRVERSDMEAPYYARARLPTRAGGNGTTNFLRPTKTLMHRIAATRLARLWRAQYNGYSPDARKAAP